MDRHTRALIQSKVNHNLTTGHADIMTGGNFIECFTCLKHAHLMEDCKSFAVLVGDPLETIYLVEHDRDHQYWEIITPDKF